MTEHPSKHANGTTLHTPTTTGRDRRRSFKAELSDLRERMCALGLGYAVIAVEMARRYQLRPREAYRLAHGWTLDKAAELFNARAAEVGADPHGRSSLQSTRLGEYEKWPTGFGRKPSPYALCVLA